MREIGKGKTGESRLYPRHVIKRYSDIKQNNKAAITIKQKTGLPAGIPEAALCHYSQILSSFNLTGLQTGCTYIHLSGAGAYLNLYRLDIGFPHLIGTSM